MTEKYKAMSATLLFEEVTKEENREDPFLWDEIFTKLTLFTKDQTSILEDVWAERVKTVDDRLDKLKEEKAEKELEVTKLKMTMEREKKTLRDLKLYADKLERAKFRKLARS